MIDSTSLFNSILYMGMLGSPFLFFPYSYQTGCCSLRTKAPTSLAFTPWDPLKHPSTTHYYPSHTTCHTPTPLPHIPHTLPHTPHTCHTHHHHHHHQIPVFFFSPNLVAASLPFSSHSFLHIYFLGQRKNLKCHATASEQRILESDPSG